MLGGPSVSVVRGCSLLFPASSVVDPEREAQSSLSEIPPRPRAGWEALSQALSPGLVIGAKQACPHICSLPDTDQEALVTSPLLGHPLPPVQQIGENASPWVSMAQSNLACVRH